MLSGADRWAQERAIVPEIPYCGMPTRWLGEGPRAGPRRNQRMLEKWRPQLVVAFAGGDGTADMIARVEAAGATVHRAA